MINMKYELGYYTNAALRAFVQRAAANTGLVARAVELAPDVYGLSVTVTGGLGERDAPLSARVQLGSHLSTSDMTRKQRDALIEQAQLCDGESYIVEAEQVLAEDTISVLWDGDYVSVGVKVVVCISATVPLTRSEKSLLTAIGKRQRVRESRTVLTCAA